MYDGNSVNSKSLMRLCNNQQNPGPITSSGNSMLIRFRSDGSQEAGGFQLSYQTLCNNVLKKRTGIIESPNFPNSYPHNHNCSWTIEAPPGNNISIAFSHLFIEESVSCDVDYVEVIEVAKNGEHTQLGKYCGGVSRPPSILNTTSNTAIIRLITDSSISMEGFRLEYRMKGCGGDFANKDSGTITSPNFPNGYPFATVCVWHISVSPGERVELALLELDLEGDPECRYDYVRVFGGEDEESPRLLNACHVISGPQVITSHGNRMMVKFSSDHSIAGRGFKASFKKTAAGCGGIFSATESTIMSPNFPDPYTANDACEWLIKVDSTHLVVLEFYDFDLPAAENCTQGYVAVYDGNSSSAALLLKHCGTKPEGVFQSTGNQILVRLVADGNNVGKGFRAHYKTGCGQRLLADNGGEITSPNYPDLSTTMTNCSWIIYASDPGEKVILTITHLFIPENENCSFYSLMLLDGETSDSPLIKEICGYHSHLPIVSESNILHVFSKHVGIFRATYGLASTHCGGMYTSAQGSFASPGYPHNYDMGMECVWIVEASVGNKVHLSFQGFNLEDSEYCNNDYVEIHEGDASGALIGRYCGHRIPSNVTAVRKLWIKFKSDDVGTDSGFMAHFALLHGTELQGNEGEIASPGYPLKYQKDDKYDWTIIVGSGMYVSVRFLEIGIVRISEQYPCSSAVNIFDGLDDQAPLLGQYCGYIIPEAVVSTGNVILIRFSASNIYSGSFRIQWTAVTESGIVVDVPNISPENTCWEELQLNSSEQVTVSSPNYPNSYPSDSNCTYIIRAPHYQHVELNLTELELESERPPGVSCVYDSLSVYYLTNPSVNEWTLNSTLCGRQNNLTLVSPTNMMKLVFVTDAFVNYKGFTATANSRCGTYLTGSTGVLKSDYIYSDIGQLNQYQAFQCEFIIRVRQRRTIELDFDNFNVPSDSVCSSTYIMLRNGGTSSSPYLGNGKYCGTNRPASLSTSSNEVYIQVVLPPATSAIPHFEIRYSELSLGCGGRLFLTDQVTSLDVISPNYPQPPTHDTECEWVIVSPSGTRMRMDFESEFHLSPNCYEGDDVEYLEIHDGGTEMAPLLHRYCGHDHPSSVMSTGNALFARYVTAVDIPQAGFKATIRVANCGGTISSYQSTITSPHYPGSYGNSEECEWFLKMKEGYHIVLTLTDLDTPTSYNGNCTITDYLEIRSYDSEGEVLGIYCGNIANSSITISVPGPQAYVKFKSNSANTGRGFSMNMAGNFDDGCGARIEGPSGRITSPNYPYGVTAIRDCYWRIVAPPGRKVKLTFEEFNLPRDETTGICLSYIMVFNATRWRLHGEEREKICGSTLPGPLNSTGDLDIGFFTHGLSAGQGFSVIYSTEEPAYCGGILPLPSGVIATPHFSVQKNTFADCNWLITGEIYGNQTLVIRFPVLDIPGNVANYCRNGVLFFSADKSYYMGRYCGNYTSMVTMTSPFPSTRVRLITNLETSFRGIQGTYNLTNCGGMLNGANANFTSPGYPNNYPVSTDCHWVINVEEGEEIRLTFTNFQLEDNCNKDYVLVRNGHHLTSPLLGKFCGSHVPAPIVSSSSALIVIFHSDEYGSAPGFRITTTELQIGCGGLIHLPFGNISSPGHPAHYENNVECTWVIEYVPGFVVKLDFVGRFDLEMDAACEKDYLRIDEFDDDKGWLMKVKKCGSSTPDSMISQSRKVRLIFHSNERITGDGFYIKYSSVCGGNFTQIRGEIFSPNYPNFYENDMYCIYTIGKPNQYISLSFDDYFSLEIHGECLYDYITIMQGNETNSTQAYCGTEAPATRTLKGPVTLMFLTDNSYTAHGFKANYEIIDCGATLREPSGIISTPTTSKEFLEAMQCTWQIVAQPNRVIALRFRYFNVKVNYKCYMDYLEIRDGLETDRLIGKLCGNSTPTVKSTGSMLTLRLYLNSRYSDSGFSAYYYNTYGPVQGCGGTNIGSSGYIQSFDDNSDGMYEPNLDCNWLIITDNSDKVLQITFERFDLEGSSNGSCIYDYLELREDDGFGDLIGRYCESTMPSSIITSTNKLYVVFHTDGKTNKAGFKFSFSTIDSPCGPSSLTSQPIPQVLTSPSYPNSYPINLRCKWLIVRNLTRNSWRGMVNINITDLDMPCNGDYLKVQKITGIAKRNRQQGDRYSDNTAHSLQLCGSKVHRIQARSGLQIYFHSDSVAEEARGFSITYENANCNRTYTRSSGVITNTEWPERFNEHKVCNISIVADDDKTISLYFGFMDILRRSSSTSISCENTYLKIYDGANNLAPLLRTICNNESPVPPIFSTGNSLNIVSNLESLYGRFYITYMTTDQYPGCGGHLTAEEGTLTSPLYPQPFNKSTECMWYISVPGYHSMKVEFLMFSLPSLTGCTTNYLEIYDGISGDISERVARFCGTDLPAVHTSRNSDVMIKLVTDTSNTGSGFLLHFKTNPYTSDSSSLIQRNGQVGDNTDENVVYWT